MSSILRFLLHLFATHRGYYSIRPVFFFSPFWTTPPYEYYAHENRVWMMEIGTCTSVRLLIRNWDDMHLMSVRKRINCSGVLQPTSSAFASSEGKKLVQHPSFQSSLERLFWCCVRQIIPSKRGCLPDNNIIFASCASASVGSRNGFLSRKGQNRTGQGSVQKGIIMTTWKKGANVIMFPAKRLSTNRWNLFQTVKRERKSFPIQWFRSKHWSNVTRILNETMVSTCKTNKNLYFPLPLSIIYI